MSLVPLKKVKLTILYDNSIYSEGLTSAWGFSCLIEAGNKKILFDTGGDQNILRRNMWKMKINPEEIEKIFLSHVHGDHTGGLPAVLHPGVKVYLLKNFPNILKKETEKCKGEIFEINYPSKITQSLMSTGELNSVKEQSLLISSVSGVIVLTGCAHPGVTKIVEKAKKLMKDKIYLVIGGYHLFGSSRREVMRVVDEFREMEVEKVAPCHCTGQKAKEIFRESFKENFVETGVGRVISVP